MKYSAAESKTLEFKEKIIDYKRFTETVIAFANTQGGEIIIGVRDSDREIVGLSDTEIRRYHSEIHQVIIDTINPQMAVQVFEQNFGDAVCMITRVYPGPHSPYFSKKMGYPDGIFIRVGAHNRQADDFAVRELERQKSHQRYENELVTELTYELLNPLAIERILAQPNAQTFSGCGYSTMDIAGHSLVNVAGALLFSKEPQKYIAEANIQVAVYAGTDKKALVRQEVFSTDIIGQLEAAFQFILNHTETQYELSGLTKKAQAFLYPDEAIREACVNAIVHRAYDYEAPVRITIFSNRIEFLNPGTFFAPINENNLKEGLSRYRNPLIAGAFRKIGIMEKQGIGISRIIDSCLESGLPEPTFTELENHVKVTLHQQHAKAIPHSPKTIKNQDYINHFEKSETLSSAEFAQIIGKSQSMAKKILKKMKDEKLITTEGSGPSSRYRLRR
jgi:ATP-dependent DNA helicase RecG